MDQKKKEEKAPPP
jgi:hypothetical protein